MAELKITPDTWIISDTHFLHDNIVKYCDRPGNHNSLMSLNWASAVQPEDTILHLGDIFMGNATKAAKLIAKLPGDKWFIRGNHDHKALSFYANLGFKHVGQTDFGANNTAYVELGEHRILFTHYPDVTWMDKWTINVHGHIHNNKHGYNLAERDYRNVSVEVMDYAPTRLRDIIDGTSYAGRLEKGTQSKPEERLDGGR
jgi:calcineurin-like phosphoesterase family protein